ncbi:MAG: sugar-binding domain-containing protein [Ignavibacteriaceae bacterium]
MKKSLYFVVCIGLFLTGLSNISFSQDSDWHIAKPPLKTRWTDLIYPGNVYPEYPRPQLVRSKWKNLNGLWQFKESKDIDSAPIGKNLPENILVPYPIESALSGIMKRIEYAWYRKVFNIPKDWSGKRIFLHFGAVNWKSVIYINGKILGVHYGGYDSFSYDITDLLESGQEQELIVGVYNPADSGNQPRGKQVNKPGGIWYTPSTGIWQTVWLEPVPKDGIKSIKIVPDIDLSQLNLTIRTLNNVKGLTARVYIIDNNKFVAEIKKKINNEIKILIPHVKLWSPSNPFLYNLKIVLLKNNRKIDSVESYFGMRKIEIGKDNKGVTRILLNHHFLFQIGVLDQGFWPDGIYTAPSDNSMKYDIETIKKLGFNMIRKHVKVEPERWYYWCDKLGVLVWQDMPSGNNQTPESKKQFEVELKRLIIGKFNHPSIIMWVIFNEGWGQFNVKYFYSVVNNLDKTRLIDCTSGWQYMGYGDVFDIHRYPVPVGIKPCENRASVEGEFGGLGLPVKGHTWEKQHWGYKSVESYSQLTSEFEKLMTRMIRLKDLYGMSAAVYTQLTDVESEVNGLMTYDRDIIKVDTNRVLAINKGLMPYILPEYTNFIDSVFIKINTRLKNAKIHYTLDDTEPSLNSKLYSHSFLLKNSGTVKARIFVKEEPIGLITTVNFKKVKGIEPDNPEHIKNGLNYEYFQLFKDYKQNYGSHWKLNDNMLNQNSNVLPVVKKGVEKNFDLSQREQNVLFGFKFSGYIKISKDGVYTFFIKSDDSGRLFIDDQKVVGDLGLSPKMSEEWGSIPLKKGMHKILLNYYQAYGSFGLKVYYKGPGITKTQIPEKILFRTLE